MIVCVSSEVVRLNEILEAPITDFRNGYSC
jgi:hypothetical protein